MCLFIFLPILLGIALALRVGLLLVLGLPALLRGRFGALVRVLFSGEEMNDEQGRANG